MKKTIITALLSLSILASTVSPVSAHKLVTKKVESKNVTIHMLTTRKDRVQLVEVANGKCLNAKKDGKILNGDRRYNYISYRGVKSCHTGDKVKTYLYFDPNCNYTDCIYRRVDVVTCKHSHKTVKTDRIWLDDMCK